MRISEMADKPNSSQKKKTINEEYEQLKDYSADELMQKLAKEIQQQKLSGAFDYNALLSSIEQLKTYLPTQTYENMIRIIENFK